MYTDEQVREQLEILLRGATCRELGDRLGIDFAHLSRIVNGRTPVSYKVAGALGFEPCERRWRRKP